MTSRPVRSAKGRRVGKWSVGLAAAALVLVTLLSGIAAAAGAPQCYALADQSDSDDYNRLVSFAADDVAAATLIGSAGTDDIEAIAFDPVLDVLWGMDSVGGGAQLGVIDITTGDWSPVLPSSNTAVIVTSVTGPTDNDVSDIDAMAVDPVTGLIWASNRNGNEDSIFVLDPVTGAIVPDYFGPGVDGVDAWHAGGASWAEDIDDFAIDPDTGVLYAVANAGGNDDRLVWIDKNTGEIQRDGVLPGDGVPF